MSSNLINQQGPSSRVIVTVLGKDKVGIIANVAQVLANCNANILDISQTILQEFFTMIMIVDIANCTIDFTAFENRLAELGQSMAIEIRAQREDVFQFMHRI